MGAQEQLKLDIITKVISGVLSRSQAMELLQVSDQSIRRYLNAYKKKGFLFCKHGNFGKTPVNKTDLELKTKVMNLVQEKYFDFNMLHRLEVLLKEGYYINRETFRRWCHESGQIKTKYRRKSKARYIRQRMEKTGLLLQMDGSHHQWFNYKESCLIATIDDANSEVLHGEFFDSEDTLSCMNVLQKIIEKKGLFNILYVDKAGLFGGAKRTKFSQMKRALNELGIHIIFANSAEAKGRIERLFKTTQDRLIPELRLNDIRSKEKANDYLREIYWPNHNSKYSVLPKSKVSAFKDLPKEIDLKQVFCLKESRQVLSNHTISWGGKFYSFKSPTGFSIKKQYIEVRTYQDKTWKAFYANKEVVLTRVFDVFSTLPKKVA